jgi:hypothetical protein
VRLLFAALCVASCAGNCEAHPEPTPSRVSEQGLEPLASDELCVTHGQLEGDADQLRIDDAEVRAFAPGTDSPSELRFRFLGSVAEPKPLASGMLRTQIGLKLRAENGCNLLYVMWRLSPEPALVVSLKRNPGMHVHDECGVGGYENLRADHAGPLPSVEIGVPHSLRAAITGPILEVWADDASVWRGPLPPAALELRGVSGVRTDNGRFTLQLFAAASAREQVFDACR